MVNRVLWLLKTRMVLVLHKAIWRDSGFTLTEPVTLLHSPSLSRRHGQYGQYGHGLPNPPRTLYNPAAQYQAGQPQAGPSQQHAGHRRLTSNSTFGGSSGPSGELAPDQTDPRSSVETNDSGTSNYTLAPQFRIDPESGAPILPAPKDSSSGGWYAYHNR